MRIFGYLFVLLLLVAVVGFFRGWFSVSTTHAAGKGGVTMEVDKDKIGEDATATAARLGELSSQAMEKVKSLGRKVGSEESELEGTLTLVDLTARDVSVSAGSETIDLHVPTGVTITSNGESVGLEQLRTTMRVKLSFEHVGEGRRLSRIEILR